METVKEMDSSSREPSEEASSRMACRVTTIVVEVLAVVAMAVEIITTSRVILEEECHQVACQVASTEEAEVEVEECTKVAEATTRPKVVKTSKTLSKIKTTTIRPSNANSSKAAEIVLMGISVPSLMGPLNCR